MSEVTVTRAPRRGMIALRGDLGASALTAVCAGVTDVAFPGQMQANVSGESGLCWMSPDEVLVMVPNSQLDTALNRIKDALQGTHFMAENVSDARAILVVDGAFAREVMAKCSPVDLHTDSFAPGQFRRSRLGQVAAAFWMRDARTFEVICFASVADYAQELLSVSARMGPVGHL